MTSQALTANRNGVNNIFFLNYLWHERETNNIPQVPRELSAQPLDQTPAGESQIPMHCVQRTQALYTRPCCRLLHKVYSIDIDITTVLYIYIYIYGSLARRTVKLQK